VRACIACAAPVRCLAVTSWVGSVGAGRQRSLHPPNARNHYAFVQHSPRMPPSTSSPTCRGQDPMRQNTSSTAGSLHPVLLGPCIQYTQVLCMAPTQCSGHAGVLSTVRMHQASTHSSASAAGISLNSAAPVACQQCCNLILHVRRRHQFKGEFAHPMRCIQYYISASGPTHATETLA
jgi:hypothetical protein